VNGQPTSDHSNPWAAQAKGAAVNRVPRPLSPQNKPSKPTNATNSFYFWLIVGRKIKEIDMTWLG
jgi:hypothetical protein